MLQGSFVQKLDGTSQFTPAFGRGGLAATFVIEVLQIEGTPSVTVTPQGRAAASTAWTDMTAFDPMTTVGVKTLDLDNCQEMMRFKVDFDAGDATTDGLRLRFDPPSWRPLT